MDARDHAKLIQESRRLRVESRCIRAEARQKAAHLAWTVDAIRREWQPDFFRPLQDAIRVMHGCESRHLASFAVRKVGDGTVLWVGMVEEFVLAGMIADLCCYAWQYEEEGYPRTFTLLKLGPADSPQAAVQFFLLAKSTLPEVSVPV